MTNKLRINLNIYHGKNSLSKLKEIVKEHNFKKPIVIIDKNLKNLKYIKKNINFIKNKKFLSFNSEPSYQMLDNEKKFFIRKKIDCFIAIGGGSTIDFAKGLSILYNNKGNAINYMGFPKKLKKIIPVIAIPTTTSTGSEIIYNAVFTDKKSKIKLGINYLNNYPVASILDSNLLRSAPSLVIYQSAIASLMRSIETYTSPDSDEITKYFSKQSYNLIMNALKKKNVRKHLNDLQWGCVFSMIALSNSSSGPCGVINYYLSVNFDIPQPFSYSFTAIEFIKHNIKYGYKDYGNLVSSKFKANSNKLKIFNQDLKFIQRYLNKDIYKIKKNLINKSKLSDEIYKIFEKKKFLPLLKNPITIKKKNLKTIINNILK